MSDRLIIETGPDDAASLTAVSPEYAADPQIRRKLLQIRRRQIELALREEAVLEGAAAESRRGPRPVHGPCTRCGHIWRGRYSKYPPLHCARCHSRYWMQTPQHGERSRLPTDPPHPNWKPLKGHIANQYTAESASAAPRTSNSNTDGLPPPPRPAVRPLAEMLHRYRNAAAAAPAPTPEPQPERFGFVGVTGVTENDSPAVVPVAEPDRADAGVDPAPPPPMEASAVHLLPDGAEDDARDAGADATDPDLIPPTEPQS